MQGMAGSDPGFCFSCLNEFLGPFGAIQLDLALTVLLTPGHGVLRSKGLTTGNSVSAMIADPFAVG